MTEHHAEQPILQLHGLSKVYPGTVALQDVSLEVRRGETHGIIGKNGAGKTTLVGIVAGLVQPTAGTIRINNTDYSDLSRIVAKKERVSIVPQEPQMVRDCSVAENLFMPDFPTRGGGLFMDRAKLYARAEQIVARGRLRIDVRAKAGDLGIGMQQILLMLKASYVERAEIIILDEAFSSLSKTEETLFFEIMRDKKAEGCTILHISHRIDELLEVCDRMTVLRDGRAVATVRRDEVDKEKLSALIVGPLGLSAEVTRGLPVDGTVAPPAPPAAPAVPGSPAPAASPAASPAAPVLSVRGLSSAESYIDISFDVHHNEILGIAGLMGSGRTEILKSIYGMHPFDSGQIQLHGKTVRFSGPSEALRHKVAYLPEDRDGEGLVGAASVKNNLVLSALRRVCAGPFVSAQPETRLAHELAAGLELKFASLEQEVWELSGGNRQKVVAAKVMSTRPDLYLLDEPTKGIDIAAKAVLLRIIQQELAPGAAVVLTSPGLEELIQICDRILILHNGRLVGEIPRAEFREDLLYAAIQGQEVPLP